ncbi:hypothetical protein ACW9YQ_17720 (plasmid) [Paraburkholderia strydomiana]
MTIAEVARYLFVSRAYVPRLLRRGDLRGSVGGGGEVVADDESVRLYQAMQEAAAKALFRTQTEEDEPPVSRKQARFTLEGDADGVNQLGAGLEGLKRLTGRRESRVISGVGHNFPQGAPHTFAGAILDINEQLDGQRLSRPSALLAKDVT